VSPTAIIAGVPRGRLLLAVSLLVLVAAVPLAFASSAKVKVVLATKTKPFALAPVPTKVKAGKVTFVASNKGALDHELVVLKTNLAPTKLPVKGTKAVEVGRVGKIPPLKPGQTKTLTLTLKPGKYVLICNVAGHYKAGQHAAFTVG
jgi:uncharacterized cupredoxin-like copper-binding protein